MSRRPDSEPATSELFAEYQPRPVVERFSPERVRASSAAARIKQAVKETLRQAGRSRETIAAEISAYLGERVSPQILDQYTSGANENSNIPAHRLVALFAVTGDIRLINALLADTDAIAVPSRCETLLRIEHMRELRERLTQEIESADAEWRAGR